MQFGGALKVSSLQCPVLAWRADFVLMMTNRPDKIDIDLKRPGRLDVKIPFFFPQDQETRLAVTKALIRKNKLDLSTQVDLN